MKNQMKMRNRNAVWKTCAFMAVFLFFWARMSEAAPTFPSLSISNEKISALIYLPDSQKGYYRASRFDWSGFVGKIVFAGKTYFSDFVVPHDPTFPGAGTGLADEFSEPLGFAGPGKDFIKIGVGVLAATNTGGYAFAIPYQIKRPGEWRVSSGKDWVRFSQELAEDGFAYRYDKKISLNGSDLLVEFALSNAGVKVVATSFYTHNFFVPEGRGVGTDDSLTLNFHFLSANRWRDRIDIRGSEIRPVLNLENETVNFLFDGLAIPGLDLRAILYDHRSKIGAEVLPQFPVSRCALYLAKGGFCPEPFLSLQLSPGASTNWRCRYHFFQGPKPVISREEMDRHSVSGFNRLEVNGRELDTFSFSKTNYSVAVTDGKIPRVRAFGLDPSERFEWKQSSAFSEPAALTLRGGKSSGRSYAIRFVRIDGISVSASETNDNLPIYSLDEDADTSWVGEKDGGFIRYDFSPPRKLFGIGILFRSGDKRRAFYEVESSSDGVAWEKDFSGSSSGTNASAESVSLKNPRLLRSIRIIGHGNSQNKYNNIVQTAFYESEKK